jgi:hypothetical protein
MILKPNIPAVPFSGAVRRANRTVGGAGRIACVPNTPDLSPFYSNLIIFTIQIGKLAMRSRVTPGMQGRTGRGLRRPVGYAGSSGAGPRGGDDGLSRTVTAITIVANVAGNPAALMIQPMTATHSDPTS